MARDELEEFLNKKGMGQSDKELIFEFFRNIVHPNRERMLGIITGHENMLPVFIDILKKKKDYAHTGSESLGEKLLALEKQTISNLLHE